MDIYWQITVIQSLQNVAVFALAVIAFGLVRHAAARWNVQWLSDVAVGCLMGAATAANLLLPVHVSGGAPIGTETILLVLVGVVAGTCAAIPALLLAVAAQLSPLLNGMPLDRFGFAMLVTAAVTGVVFRRLLPKRDGRMSLSYYHFPILGVISAVLGLCVLCYYQGWTAAMESALAAVLASVAASTILGTLLLHEMRRHEAEKELRASEARLAKQAHELARARDTAERANKAKSAFLANMSHELRTPLNAIIGFSEILSQETLGPVGSLRYKEYAGDINSSGVHLLSLINDLLDVAKIESGKMEIAPHPIDVRGSFESALRLIEGKAREKKQKLTMAIAPDVPPLYADTRAIKQIVVNLVSNAVKFTPEGGKISVQASAAGDGQFQIVCEDNGPGIPRDKLESIFTPFSQIDNRYERQEGGTGLGLSLVRGLVELHGGRVWLESEYGNGCRACIVLPSQAPAAEVRPPEAARTKAA